MVKSVNLDPALINRAIELGPSRGFGGNFSAIVEDALKLWIGESGEEPLAVRRSPIELSKSEQEAVEAILFTLRLFKEADDRSFYGKKAAHSLISILVDRYRKEPEQLRRRLREMIEGGASIPEEK